MSAGLLWVCVPTLAVLLILYGLTDVSQPDVDSATNTHGPRAVPTLQLVIVFTRHGSRGPVFAYPTSPYQALNTTYWPNGWMELTEKGHMQLYLLGKKFRSLYDGFLGEVYRQEDFRANSTLYQRSMMSASQFLAGLFPARGSQMRNGYLPWQPVPIYPVYVDRHEIAYVKNSYRCSKLQAVWKMAVRRFLHDYQRNITDLLEFVKPYTGIDFAPNSTESVWVAMYMMWESIYTVVEEGLPLPAWTDKIYPQPITFLAEQNLRAASVGSDTQIRYLEGEYFKEVVSLMKAKVGGTLRPDRRMFHFSAHDFSLLGLQGILGLAKDRSGRLSARTGSALILEIHKNLQTDQFYVQVNNLKGIHFPLRI
ncbi:hypothetical protein J6590_023469 [Homalodisca vitripennis]|nr:hypothetical protein J6590_023469 [Homalodisca vitripennis]